jgi:hypothetical protein
MVRRPVPDDWKPRLKADAVELLPLTDRDKRDGAPGWCTYTSDFDSPETDVFCGGLNSKTHAAAAVWRQGHLLHFGFDLAPSEMNATGRALLVNAIAYSARFPEDRPIPRTPSPFEGTEANARADADAVLARDKFDPQYLEWLFSDGARRAGNAKDVAAFKAWYKRHRPFLHADAATGKLVVDEEAKAFGVAPETPDFFPKALAALRAGGESAERARQLLRRYAPQGPSDGDADAWQTWWQDHRPYLFFCDSGWYQWYVDPLAKKRGVPTAELRGEARATKR